MHIGIDIEEAKKKSKISFISFTRLFSSYDKDSWIVWIFWNDFMNGMVSLFKVGEKWWLWQITVVENFRLIKEIHAVYGCFGFKSMMIKLDVFFYPC